MRTTKTDRLSDYDPLDPWPYRALTLAQVELCDGCAASWTRISLVEKHARELRDQLDTEKAEHIEKDNLLQQYADAATAQAHRILNLQAEAEAQRHRYRTTMLGALLAVLLLIATVITGAVTAVPKQPSPWPAPAVECHTDSECEGVTYLEWEADV